MGADWKAMKRINCVGTGILLLLIAASCGGEEEGSSEMVLAYRVEAPVSEETFAELLVDQGVVSIVEIPADSASGVVRDWFSETVGLVVSESLEPGTIVLSEHIGVPKIVARPWDLTIAGAPSLEDYETVWTTVDGFEVGVLCVDDIDSSVVDGMASYTWLSEVANPDPSIRTFETIEPEDGFGPAWGYGVRGSTMCVSGVYAFDESFVKTVSRVLLQR